MTRPGWLVHAEHDARDHYERHDWDTPPDHDEPPPERATEPVPAVERAIERQRLVFEQARRAEHERNAR